MQIIETISTEGAGAALGLGPAAVRQRIKSGQLAAVRVGRSWRIGVKSVNDLLSAAEVLRRDSGTATMAHSAKASDSKTPVEESVPEPHQEPIFSDSDLRQINQFRINLAHYDPEIRDHARFQLEMFDQRAKAQAAWKPPVQPPKKPSPEALRNLFW